MSDQWTEEELLAQLSDKPPVVTHAMLKKPEIIRDENGRFDRHGKTLAKTQKKVKPERLAENNSQQKKRRGIGKPFEPGMSGNPDGRPKGVPNKVTTALKDMILNALDKAGGEDYLAALARENSSAFGSLLGKVLPTTLAASDSDGGLGLKVTFERHIVWPDGRKEIEGVTPKQLPPPSSHSLPNDEPVVVEPNDIKDLD